MDNDVGASFLFAGDPLADIYRDELSDWW